MSLFSRIFIISSILLSLDSEQYIVLPIYTDNPINNTTLKISNTSEFLNKIFSNDLYTYIQIGTPKSKIYTYLDTQCSEFYLPNSESLFWSNYSSNNSSSFKL